MISQGYPKLNLYTKKQLANAIRGKNLSFDEAIKLIDKALEIHPRPEEALSDGAQSLLPEQYKKLITDLKKIALALGREI